MKVTLDHNCIINLERRTAIGETISTIVKNPCNECFIVNIGASELREKGVRPDKYELFEELLAANEINHLPRINPMFIFDVTFWDKCVFPSEEMMKLLISQQYRQH